MFLGFPKRSVAQMDRAIFPMQITFKRLFWQLLDVDCKIEGNQLIYVLLSIPIVGCY